MRLETFFEKFDQFAEAPNAITKIRELVLELAVSGKLSSPISGDAAVFSYKDFSEQVIQLSASLGLRSQKETSGEVESPFEVPEHWHWFSLGDIGVSQTGTTPSKNDHEAFNGEIPFIKPADIFPDVIRYDNESLTRRGAESGSRLAPAGSLLMVCIGTIGKCNLIDRECSFNQQINSLTPVEAIDPRFLLFAVRAPYFQRFAWKKSSSTTIAIINKGKWVSIPVPVPPLAEQKRIVMKVDELMALCDRLEAQLQERDNRHAALARASLASFADAPAPANLNLLFHPAYTIAPAGLRKTILTLAVQGRLVPQDPNDETGLQLFRRIEASRDALISRRAIKPSSRTENPNEADADFAVPIGWLWTRLGNVFDVRDGTHDTPKYSDDGFPLITSKNISSGVLSFDTAKFISEEDHRKICERSRVDRGDILFAMIGSIGNPVIVDTDREFSIKNVAVFKYFEMKDVEPRFLLHYLTFTSESMRSKAAGGVQSFVSLGFLRNYPFPLPPLFEQRRIVAKVDQLMTLVNKLELQLSDSRSAAINLMDAVVAELTAQE